MAYHIKFVCFYGYQKMLRFGTFLSKCSQRFIDLIDVITSKIAPVFLSKKNIIIVSLTLTKTHTHIR